jgi:hypothetical protein
MDLLLLAPAIQNEVLLLPVVTTGRDPHSERQLRASVPAPEWGKERKAWEQLAGGGTA